LVTEPFLKLTFGPATEMVSALAAISNNSTPTEQDLEDKARADYFEYKDDERAEREEYLQENESED
jgi:hypothetical protein